jgi:hypothetical protein
MEIIGHKNLMLTKKALLSHLQICTEKALMASDDENRELWDPELAETNNMLEAVELNLKLEKIKEG